MDNKKQLFPDELILNKIYVIRGTSVMLDRDLADLYNVKAIRLREQVKRNRDKFPGNFMFQLNQEEVEVLVSQNAIPSIQHLGGSLPFVFTEHGILQLANVLKSKTATQISIQIIEIFVQMRKTLVDTTLLKLEIEKIKLHIKDQDNNVQELFTYLDELIKEQQKPGPKKRIGFRLPGSG